MDAWRIARAENHHYRLRLLYSELADELCFAFKKDIMDAVFASLDSPQTVHKQVCRMVSSNVLGKGMFGDTLHTMLSNMTSDKVAKFVKEEVRGKHLDAELWSATARKALVDARAVDPEKVMKFRHIVAVPYRDIDVLVKVSSLNGEVELHISSHLKHAAVHAGELPELTFEKNYFNIL